MFSPRRTRRARSSESKGARTFLSAYSRGLENPRSIEEPFAQGEQNKLNVTHYPHKSLKNEKIKRAISYSPMALSKFIFPDGIQPWCGHFWLPQCHHAKSRFTVTKLAFMKPFCRIGAKRSSGLRAELAFGSARELCRLRHWLISNDVKRLFG